MGVHLKIRSFVPRYAVRNGVFDLEYAPWVVGHADRRKLTDETLNAEVEAFQNDRKKKELVWNDIDVMDNFYGFLDARGYTVFSIEGPGVFIVETAVANA